MNVRQRGIIAATAVALCGLAVQLPASAQAPAKADTTPPTLNTPLKAHFITGSQLDQSDFGDGLFFYNVPERFSWSGSDDSGFVTYRVRDYFYGENPRADGHWGSATTKTVTGSDYIDQEGGGSQQISNWSVQAKDGSGNGVEKAVLGTPLVVTQDDGSQTPGYHTNDVNINYSAGWLSSSCGCFAAGTTHKTSEAGASFTVTVKVPASEVQRSVAIVMEKAPGRGKATVRVDGVADKTIDTFAATATHQVVAWQGTLTTGTHHIKVVNKATAGRPRIDLDAVVIN